MFDIKNYSKSVDFLLENAGPVIQYRLHKEILKDIDKNEEENLLNQVYEMPWFQLLKTYVKPNGYIGSGMHSWDNWRGTVLHETPLQDGESAARLLSYYRIPKEHPVVKNFVSVLRDEEALRKEFSYIPPEIPRFNNRFEGINNGNSLMSLVYTLQAMLGYGDDYNDLKDFQQISLKGFCRILEIQSLEEITKFNPDAKRKYNYPYIEADEYFPNVYTVSMLAYTKSWRSKENLHTLSDAFNHINAIMKPDNNMHVHIKGKYTAPCFALIRPVRAFDTGIIDVINYRRLLTEIAMTGAGMGTKVIRQSADNINEALGKDGILHLDFTNPYNKHYSPEYLKYPSPYTDVMLEASYKDKNALLCDLTFWALEFLFYLCACNKT
jgi:hypothetical protein